MASVRQLVAYTAWRPERKFRMGKFILWATCLVLASSIEIHGQPSAKPPAGASGGKGASIIQFGEYSTTDNLAIFVPPPVWKFVKETTEIKRGAANGFGIRYSFPGPFTEGDVLVSITIIGGFGPPDTIGYEFKSKCSVKGNRCIGDMIIPCGGSSPPRSGEVSIIAKYKEESLTKTFRLSD
jgi:hypothetical protein